MLDGNIFITGGTGTLGYALAKRITSEQWPCNVTIYSRAPEKQQAMKRLYPRFRYVLGDICDRQTLQLAITGHDLVIHCAAQKHIPEAERQPLQCYNVNVVGSMFVLEAAIQAGVKQVLGISTDKVCHAINAYGLTKAMMERAWQSVAVGEYGRYTKINLCRYGNVLGSTGSVLEVWAGAVERGEPIKITNKTMTRFWLTSSQAVDLLLYSLDQPSGTITIPMLHSLSMGRMADYLYGSQRVEEIGLRPGEKLHEELLTPEEAPFARAYNNYIELSPVTGTPNALTTRLSSYTSDAVPRIDRLTLYTMLGLNAVDGAPVQVGA